jgi:hypothetical protein
VPPGAVIVSAPPPLLTLPPPRCRTAAGHRSPRLVEERRRRSGFSPPPRRQGAPVSYRLHPHARRVASPPWVLECRLLLHLHHCSSAAGHAATRAQRTVTTSVCARALRRTIAGRAGRGRPDKPWVTRAVHTGRASAVGVGHAPLCKWAEHGFGPVAVELVFHFPNIFKFLQI